MPAYSTQARWLGFSDERMTELIKQNISSRIDKFKFKVRGSVEDDIRQLRAAREAMGHAHGGRKPVVGRARSDRGHGASCSVQADVCETLRKR